MSDPYEIPNLQEPTDIEVWKEINGEVFVEMELADEDRSVRLLLDEVYDADGQREYATFWKREATLPETDDDDPDSDDTGDDNGDGDI